MATIIISILIFLCAGLVAFKLYKNKKAGKSGCSCGCSACAMSNICHSKNDK